MKARPTRTSWLIHTPMLNKGIGTFLTLMMLVPFVYAIYLAIVGNLLFKVFAITTMIIIPIFVYYAVDYLKRGNKHGWVEYDTIRVSIKPEELVQILSGILKQADLSHEVLKKPLGDEYTAGSSFALWIPKDNIGLWLADHGPMKSMPSVRLALGKKTANNAETMAQYKDIIDNGLEQNGVKLYNPPMP